MAEEAAGEQQVTALHFLPPTSSPRAQPPGCAEKSVLLQRGSGSARNHGFMRHHLLPGGRCEVPPQRQVEANAEACLLGDCRIRGRERGPTQPGMLLNVMSTLSSRKLEETLRKTHFEWIGLNKDPIFFFNSLIL